MLYKLAATAHRQTEAAKHASTFRHVRVSLLPMLDIDVKGVTLKKDLEVGIMLEYRVCSRFAQHALECRSSRFYKAVLKSSDGLFFGRWGYHDARIVAVQLVI